LIVCKLMRELGVLSTKRPKPLHATFLMKMFYFLE
jgi:hypothetical protein